MFILLIFISYQKYQGLNELQTTLRFLPAGISGREFGCFVS